MSDRPTPEERFLAWLATEDLREDLAPSPADGLPLPVTWLLGTLCLSHQPLPDWARRRLGYEAPTRIGDAATELLLAVHDPGGPRDGSYRAAMQRLRERTGVPHA